MSTERFEKTAGSPALQSLDDPGFVAFSGIGAIRWVRVPSVFPVEGLRGARIAVERVEPCECFVCERMLWGEGTPADAYRYVLAATPLPVPADAAPGTVAPVLGLIDCPRHGFLWHATDNEP